MGVMTSTDATRFCESLKRSNTNREFQRGAQNMLEALPKTTSISEEATPIAMAFICGSNRGYQYRLGAFTLAVGVGCTFEGDAWERIAKQFRQLQGGGS